MLAVQLLEVILIMLTCYRIHSIQKAIDTHIFFGLPSVLFYLLTTVFSVPILVMIIWQYIASYREEELLTYIVCISLNVLNTVFFIWHNLLLKFIFTSKIILRSLPKSKLYFMPSAIQTFLKVVYTLVYLLLVKYE